MSILLGCGDMKNPRPAGGLLVHLQTITIELAHSAGKVVLALVLQARQVLASAGAECVAAIRAGR